MTFYWHDYETFGRSPRSDRPAQFAGIRTTTELEIVGEPLVLFCRPGADTLPDPDACLVHGILPHDAIEKGIPEADFAARIHAELATPQTCGVGYNAMRFDHEVTRYLFYRNLFDPYAWHWRNGNSRWDVIDLARAACALRPDGICWPRRDDGAHSFVLEDLARANQIEHEHAHDALADVHSLLGLARLLRSAQRPLFDYYLKLRSKQAVGDLIDVAAMRPLVFVSGRIRAALGSATLVAPLAKHPTDGNGVIVYDLRLDPTPFLGMSSEDLQHDLFAREDELPEGVIRPPLRHIHLNASPFLADARAATDPDVQGRLSLDYDACMSHLEVLRRRDDFRASAAKAFVREYPDVEEDIEEALYSGGFIDDQDRRALDSAREADPARLRRLGVSWVDGRLEDLVFRYRARNYPETLDDTEQSIWRAFCRRKLLESSDGAPCRVDAVCDRVEELLESGSLDADQIVLLKRLRDYADEVRMELMRI